MTSGRTTSAALTARFLAAIARDNVAGAGLHAVISTHPSALAIAREMDAERSAGRNMGSLQGAPILIKDNIEVGAPLPTTAGSLALARNIASQPAPVVARLTAAGAVILGAANLSEWANYRSSHSISGWSATGGQTRNPHDIARTPCGSSSGSAAAVAAGFASAAIGTETDGSITCPAAVNGVVGLKPTVGLVSRAGIVPISASQDTAGPMTVTVRDAALLLTVMAGTDPADPATAPADAHKTDYVQILDAEAMQGARIGVLRSNPATDVVFEAALERMRAAGAVLVDITEGPDLKAISVAEGVVLRTEFKAGVEAYLAGTSPRLVKTRTLADLIAFNRTHAAREMSLFGQEVFERAQAAGDLCDPDYLAARETARRLAGPNGIDRLLTENSVAALVSPTLGPAWLIDDILDDHSGGGSAARLPAVAGYPHLTVPMGHVKGLPVGLSFIAEAWSEARLLCLGYAFELLANARRRPDLARARRERGRRQIDAILATRAASGALLMSALR
jgi:amidase